MHARQEKSLRPVAGRVDTIVAVVGWAVLALFVAATVGTSLIGRTTFLGVDILQSFAPWRTDGVVAAATPPHVPLLGDTVDGFAPQAELIANVARDGALAEWNPYNQGGVELGGLPNTGMFSPVSLAWWVLPHAYAPGAMKLLEIVIVGLGMSLFLRRLGLSRATWPLATLAYVTSGFMVSWTNWPQTRVAAFIPLLFWALDRAAVRPRWREALVTAIPVASMFLGGFPAVTGYALYAGAAYVIVRAAIARRKVRSVVMGGLAALGGVALGALISAFLLMPFAWNALTVLDFSVRAQSSTMHLPFVFLSNAVLPWSTGTPDGQLQWGGANSVESFSYLGAAVVVLVAVGLALRSRRQARTGMLPFFVISLVVAVIAVYLGGPLLGAIQNLPIFSNNPVARLRVMIGFFTAVVAAFGLQVVLEPRTARDELASLPKARSTVAARVFGLVAGAGVLVTVLYSVVVARRDTPHRMDLGLQTRVALVYLVGTVVLVLVAWVVGRWWTSLVAALGILALVGVPAIDVARSWWPQNPVSMWYPVTPTHEFLDQHLGTDRYATVAQVMLPGSSTLYGQRALGGHAFITPEWRELMLAADPDMLLSPTYSTLAPQNLSKSLRSGVLDRLAVRFVVEDPGAQLEGAPGAGVPATSSVHLASGSTLTTRAFTGPVRGLQLSTSGLSVQGGEGADVVVTLTGADGKQIASTSTWARPGGGVGNVALDADNIPAGTSWTAQISLRLRSGTSAASLDVGIADDGTLGFTPILPAAGDGLDVVHTGDATVYERTTALARVRWASAEIAEPDADARVRAMADPSTNPDAVILDDPDDVHGLDGTSTATVTEHDTDTDTISAEVTSTGAGWVVVADSLRREGWSATLDGKPVPLIAAEHVGGAVFVGSAGTHVVELTYHTPLLREGLWGTGAGLLILVGGGVLVILRDRRERRLRQETAH